MEDDTIEHDRESGTITITFERFETDDDVVLPNFRVVVTTAEHVIAWVESLLSSKTLRKISKTPNEKRLQAMLRATEQDSKLVYLCSAQHHVVLVRNGRVLKVPFALNEPMDLFMRRLGEEPNGSTTATTNSEFVAFVKRLMR